MIELAINCLEKYYGAAMVLKNITFEVQTGEKVGIIGTNGCGKSTLLKVIMGLESYEKGMLTIKKGHTIGYLEQMPNYSEDFTVMDVLSSAFSVVDELYEEMRELEKKLSEYEEKDIEKTLKKYSQIQDLYESLGGYEKEEKLSKVCNGLKIDEVFKEKLFKDLSGGEKTTVILGKILLQAPNILLLDEPSNHLDLEAMEWLEQYLKEYKGIVLIVSHDRYFLDNVVSKIIEIEDMISTTYIGNYSSYVKEKEIRLQLEMENYLEQQKKIKAMEKSIVMLRDWGMRADNNKFFRRAASMQKKLDRMERIKRPILERDSMKINGNIAGRSGNDVIVIRELSKSFEDKVLLENVELLIRKGERAAIIGANGCGKSTLLKILIGELNADYGEARLGSSVKLGYLPQNICFKNEDSSVLECFREDIVITEGKAREYLAKYMFFGEAVFKKVGSLSGGERSRLKLAKLAYEEINLLILDEPTNHLDIDSREELEEFLKDFEGTIFFVSHDRYFINSIAERIVEHSSGKLEVYEGNYEYYKEKKLQEKAKKAEQMKIEAEKSTAKKKKTAMEFEETSKEKKLRALEKQIEQAEEKLKNIEQEIEEITDDYKTLEELYKEKASLNVELEKLMSQYFL